MNKEKVLEALLNAGRGDLYDALYDEDVNVDDFIQTHYEEIKSIPDVFDKPVHGLTEEQQEEYFSGNKEKIKKYQQDEEKYNKKVIEGQAKAEEYKRSQENPYTSDNAVRNYLMGNELAAELYNKGDYEGAMRENILDKVGKASDFLPFPVSLAGPAIRTYQDIRSDKPMSVVGTLADWGTSLAGPAKGAAKAGFSATRQMLGRGLGKVMETKPVKAVEKAAEAMDKKTAINVYEQTMKKEFGDVPWDEWIKTKSPKEIQAKANEIEKVAPDIADDMRQYIQSGKIAKAEGLADEIPLSEMKAQTKLQPETIFTEEGKIDPIMQYNFSKSEIDQMMKEGSKNLDVGKGAKAGLFALRAASKPVIKTSFGTYRDEYKYDDKEYNKAISYIQKKNASNWDKMNFNPYKEGTIEYEAFEEFKMKEE